MNLHHKYFDEMEDDTGLGSAIGGENGGLGEGEDPPSFFVGKLTEDDVVNRLGQVGELGEQLSAMEGRLGEQFGPMLSRLEATEKSLGSRTAVEIPSELVAEIDAFFTKYDPKLEGAGELFKRLLFESVKQQSLDDASIVPLVQPLLDKQQYESDVGWLEDIDSRLSFDQGELRSLDPSNPKTDVQRAFLSFWSTASQSVREALTTQRADGSIANPRAFGRALIAFDQKWRKQLQEKSESAGAAANRLAGAKQTSSSGRQSTTSVKSDPWLDGIKTVQAEYGVR